MTDLDDEIFQHLEYFPFGETWVEEHSNTQRTPYLFTAKELDEETGLYYFGARYYGPRTSVWQSPDPSLSEYMLGDPNEGVNAPANLSLYAYAYLRPTANIDPDGNLNVYIGGAADNAQPGSPIYRGMQVQTAAGGDFLQSPNDLPNITARWSEANRPQLEDGSRGSSPLAQEITTAVGEFDDEPVNIMGHSWGGAAATRLANELSAEGVEVNVVVTLDPVSRWWNRQDVKDPDTRWINMFIPEDARVPNAFPDDIAETGGD